MNEVKTNSFNGLNRLPEIAEGEGRVFKNLSLRAFPAAVSEGLKGVGDLYIKADGADVKTHGSKLQAVGDIAERDGKFYLTGVYDGVFYFEGEAKEYYGDYGTEQMLNADDRVEIVKTGTQYVILGVRPDGSSVIWSYNTVGTSIGTQEDKEKDGKLKTEVIAYQIPPSPLNSLYLYKLCTYGKSDDATKAYLVEKATRKQYYMIYMYKRYYDSDISKNRSSAMKAMQVYNSYYGLINNTLMLKPGNYSFNPGMYCFDDWFSEHPVKFVIDAASLGTDNGGDIDVFNYLLKIEGEKYDIQTSISSRSVAFMDPYTISASSKDISYVPIFNSDGTLKSYENKPRDEGSGIIGHFEKWNDEKKRYEFYNGENGNPIYQVVDESGNPVYPSGTDGSTSYYNTSNESYESHTAISLSYAGLINESMTISHIALFGGRIFATVKGGSQILCSAGGKYTNFAEMQGTSMDSSFFNDSTDGEYTGLSEYSGTLLAFKENRIAVYYGTPPNMTRSRDILGVGCIDCRSIKEVGGVLYFLGKDGFYAYSGGMPRRISRKLAKNYVSATAFMKDGCYVADAVDESGKRELLTYSPEFNMWTEGEAENTIFESGGKLVGKDGKIFEFCEEGEWCFETGDIFEGIFEDKGINEIYIRGRLNGSMKVTTVSDSDEYVHTEIADDTERLKVWRIPVRLKHKNTYRIRIEGVGKCVLYALERSSYIGGRKR